MERMENNIYLVKNLAELKCEYRTYRARGLSPDSVDYHKNAQFLVDRLSRRTKSPCLLEAGNDGVHIIQPDGYQELPESLELVRTTVKIERIPGLKVLDFGSLDQNGMRLAVRFLQFALQQPVYNNPALWQPRSGYPFFNKTPDQSFRKLSQNVDLLRGFKFRIVPLPEGKIGICVDTSSKYVSRYPLPTKISRNEFRRYKGINCLYEYGDTWYEIKIEGLHDFNVSEVDLPDGTSLFDEVHKVAGRRKSQSLLSLPRDCSVLMYRNSWGQPRYVPSGLCKLTYVTEHPDVRRYHTRTIKYPDTRRREIQFVVDKYLRGLTFGSTTLELSDKPLAVSPSRFDAPDLEFGNGKVLSVRRTPGAIRASLKELGRKKKEVLYSEDAGLFVKKPFDRQYLILPRSVHESFGQTFVEDICREVNQLFSSDEKISYSPIVIPFEDSVQKSVHRVGREIMVAVEAGNAKPGYGLVMIPQIPSKIVREDELSNLITREMRERQIYVSVIHTTIPAESYEYGDTDGGRPKWRPIDDNGRRKVFKGYLKNVVLNKILLLNSYWPFVLKTPLNADLTIGIDVKNNFAGFTLVYKTGELVRFFHSESDQREQIGRSHLRSKIADILQDECEVLSKRDIKNIVIHRQGRLFPSEREGITDGLNVAARNDMIDPNHKCTFLDIRSTSSVPFRLFGVKSQFGTQTELVRNPVIGSYYLHSEDEAFICTTGYPFMHKGTTKPLHVVRTSGRMPLKSVLEDVFYLSNLTWTKVDDCSRHPLTIKMTDVRLRESAGEYDRDALQFGEDEDEGGEQDE